MDVKAEFNRAVAAARQKDFQTARTVLRDLLKEEPHHVDAWILFAHVAQNREHAIYCFERALFLDHDNTYVRQQLNRLRATGEPAPQPPKPAERPEHAGSEDIYPRELGHQQSKPADDLEPSVSESSYPREPVSQPVAHVSLLASEPDKPKKKMSTLEIILLGILGMAVVILLIVLGSNALQGGGLSAIFSGEPTPSSDILFEAIYENIRATNAENIVWYMSTIHSNSPGYKTTEQQLPDSFATYDLYVEVSGLEIVKQTRSEVQVAFTMVTRKIRGPAFRDNRVQGIFLLRPDDGIWKIYNQKIENVEYLD